MSEPRTARAHHLLAFVVVVAAMSACSGTPSDPSSDSSVSTTVASLPMLERELVEPGTMLSSAAVYGDLVWTAGHLPEGVSPNAPIEDQVGDVLDNLEQTLEKAHAGFDTLLKTNVYLLDWDDWDAFNEIYEARIGRRYCLLYTSPSPRDGLLSRMPSSA